MTDQEIEQLALEIFPKRAMDSSSDQRQAFIKGAKLIRDKYEQKLKDNDN